MVGRCARLHTDEAGSKKLAEKLDHLATTQLPLDDDLASGIHTVDLNDVLGEINADRGSLHVDGPLM